MKICLTFRTIWIVTLYIDTYMYIHIMYTRIYNALESSKKSLQLTKVVIIITIPTSS